MVALLDAGHVAGESGPDDIEDVESEGDVDDELSLPLPALGPPEVTPATLPPPELIPAAEEAGGMNTLTMCSYGAAGPQLSAPLCVPLLPGVLPLSSLLLPVPLP